MSGNVLVDASFLIAQLDERDVHHETAKALHELFRQRDVLYVYLDFVVNETITVLTRRARERKTDPKRIVQRLRKALPPETLTWTGAELPRLWNRVLDTIETYSGALSFHDCLFVLISQENQIQWAASFDRGFDRVSGLKRIGTVTAFPAE